MPIVVHHSVCMVALRPRWTWKSWLGSWAAWSPGRRWRSDRAKIRWGSPLPAPWDIEEHKQCCYIVRDGNGQALAYVYFEAEAGEGPQRDC